MVRVKVGLGSGLGLGFGLRLGFGFRLYYLSVGFFKFFKGLGLFLAWGEGFFDFV